MLFFYGVRGGGRALCGSRYHGIYIHNNMHQKYQIFDVFLRLLDTAVIFRVAASNDPTPSFYTPSASHPTPLYIGNTPRQGYLNILFAYPIFPSSFLHPAHFSFFRFQPLDFYTPTALHCVDRYQLPAKLHICPL